MAAENARNGLPVDRSVDRPTVTFDRWQLPVDRPDTESRLLCSGRPPRYREQSSLVRSTGRSTVPLCCQTCTALCTSVDRSVDRTKGRSTERPTDMHRAVHVWQYSGPVDRTRELCSLYLDGRPGGRPEQRSLLSVSGWSTGRSIGSCQRSNVTVGRSTDRSTGSSFLAEFAANGYIFPGAINCWPKGLSL